MKIIYSLLILILSNSIILSQTFHVYDVKTDDYPLMKAKFFVTDTANIQIKNLDTSQFTVYENQIERFVRNIECNDEPTFNKISTVLTIDVSGSMSGERLEWVKSAGSQWIEQMDSLNEETAITTFDDEALLYSDFSINRAKLLNSISTLEIRNGTNYKNAFLDPYAGALDVVRRANYKPVIIFLTDGVGLTDFKQRDIIKKAEELDAIIYTISIDISLPEEMKQIAEATGGQYFESINSQEKLEEVYSIIREIVINISACEISWYTEGCLVGREAKFRYLPLDLRKNVSFNTPGEIFPEFEYINDEFATFECSKSAEYIYRVKANKGEIVVKGINKLDGNVSCSDFSVTFLNKNTPFVLEKDSILEVRVRYNPSNNNYKFCEFEIDASSCFNSKLYAVGNCLDSPPTNVLLDIIRPNGGEVYKANVLERIYWNGTSKNNDVTVEYSLDSGNSWNFINRGKLYNNSDWIIPNVESNNCLIKVKQMSSDAGKKIYETSIDSSNVLAISWNKRGNLFAIVTDTNSIKLFNSITGEKVSEIYHLSDNSKIKDVQFLPDGARLFVSNENGLYLLNILNKKFDFIDSLSGEIDISNDEEIITVVNSDSVVVLDLKSRTKVKIINKTSTNAFITDVAISNDSKSIAVSDSTNDEINVIRVFKKSNNWNLTTDFNLVDNGLDYSYSNIDWSYDDNFIYSTSWHITAQFLDLWDVEQKKKIIRKIAPSDSKISDLKASHIENLIVQVDHGLKIKVWEVELIDNKYEFIEKYNFSSSVLRNNTIEWSPDGTRFVIGTTRNKNSKISKLLAVYSVKSYPVVEDISDSVFSIVKNAFEVPNIDLGLTLIGQTKDSTISYLMAYNYNYPFQIDSVTITGIDLSAFSISNTPNLPNKATASVQPSFNFSFTPYKVGVHNALLNIYTQYGIKTSKIIAKGVKPLVGIENYNFGEVLITQDSIITKNSVVNNGGSDLVINKIKLIGPSEENYSLLDNNLDIINEIDNIILSSNEELELTIRFNPTLPEISNARVEIEYINEYDNVDYKYIKLYGEGINPELDFIKNINFRPTKCNEISTEEITLYNKGKGRLKIIDIVLSSSNYEILDNISPNILLEERDSLKLRVEFNPKNIGIINESIFIFTDQLNQPIQKILLNGRKLSTSYNVEGNNRLIGINANNVVNETYRVINTGKTNLEWDTPYTSIDGKIEVLSILPNPTLQGDTSIVSYRFNGGEKGEKFEFIFAPKPICADSNSIQIEVKNTNPTLSTNFETTYRIVCEDSLLIRIPIINIGEEELEIKNIRFENNDNSKFVTNKKILNLLESQTDTLDIIFTSVVSGVFSTDFVIISNDSKSPQGKYIQKITVIKEISEFEIIDNNLEFQFIGLTNPGSKTFSISNNGSLPIRWNLLPINNFDIISVMPPVAKPGEVSVVTLIYIGPNDLSSSSNLFVSDSCSNLDSISLNVITSSNAGATVKLANEKRKIGEIFNYQLELNNASKLEDAGVTSITGELVFNHSLMIPTNSNSSINNKSRMVPFEIFDLTSSSITNIEMQALWGNDSCSVVTISNLRANGNTTNINLELELGEICISDLCYEGGVRLINLSVELGADIKVNNNSNNSLEIDLNLIERGETQIGMINMNGINVKSNNYSNLNIGDNHITTDISHISDGIYFIVIETPSITIIKKLIIIR